jgi:penicillin-binding protein 2
LKNYFKTVDSDWYKQRLTGAILCVVAAFIILFVRLFYLQLISGTEFSRLSENNCIRIQCIDSPRGLVFDRHGHLMVDNRPSFDLSIILKDAKPIAGTIDKLIRYIQAPSGEIQTKIGRIKGISTYKPVVLKQDIGRNALAAVEAHKFDLPGVIIDVKSRRHYVNDGSASHLIGYLSEISSEELKSSQYRQCRGGDFIGKFGVEKAFENFLRGMRGGRQVEVDATGRVIRVLKTVDVNPGADVHLTIDHRLQLKAEDLLVGKAGAVVVMDPRNGEVLAMASSPGFNQNAFVSGMTHEEWQTLVSNPMRPMENKAIQGEYPPGSVYKIITAMAAFEEGVIDENTTFFCPGYHQFGDRVFKCWKKGGHGNMNVVSAIEESCDVFFYQVGQKLGVDRLAWYAKACGLGSASGMEIDHEASGLVPTSDWKKNRTGIPWQAGETLSVAIGQGYNLVTPLQMANLISAVANGGKRFKPLIVSKIATPEGELILKSEPELVGQLPLGSSTLQYLKKGLWHVVNGSRGTARAVHVRGLDISGKTGTAQLFSRKADEVEREEDIEAHLKSHAWFVAFAPADDPELAMSVIVEHGEHGSSGAGPIAREIIKTYFNNQMPEKMLKAGRQAPEIGLKSQGHYVRQTTDTML